MSYSENGFVTIRQAFRVPSYDWTSFLTTAYEVRTDGKNSWLKRLAWWALRKLGATKQHWDREMMVTETLVRFNEQDAFDKVFLEARRCMYTCYGRKPEKILVGAEDFARIISDPSVINMGYFDFTGRLAKETERKWVDIIPGSRPELKFFNVPVYVIPHMQGVLVL